VLMWWQAVVLGLLEGITEYLPVSFDGTSNPHLVAPAPGIGRDKDALSPNLVFVPERCHPGRARS